MAVYGVIRVVVIMAVPLVALASDYTFAGSISSWLMPTGVNDGILKAVSGQGDIPVHCCEGVINGCCCGSVGRVIYCTGKTQSDQSSFLTDNPTPIGVGVGAVLGAVGLVAAAPGVIPATGFTSAGIAAGSVAAKLMSLTAIPNGDGVAVGSLVAFGNSGKSDQSSFLTDNLELGVGAVLGAVGLVVAAPVVFTATGFTSAGIAAGSVAAKLMSLTAIANGGGVAVGSFVAIAQSIGAAGLGAAGTAVVAFIGSTLGAVAGWAASDAC